MKKTINTDKEIKLLDDGCRFRIGQRIQERRLEYGLSGAALGAYLDITGNQVSRIETGNAGCSLEHIFVIAQVLECSVDYLLYGKEEKKAWSSEQREWIQNLYNSL